MIESAIIEIENEYFEILEKYYSDLYACYIESNKVLSIALSKYRSKQTDLTIPGYKNISSYKREHCMLEIVDFWNKNFETVEKCIQRNSNVGVYGVGDYFTNFLRSEISSNALFYDLLVFDDPIYGDIPDKLELDMEQSKNRFWADVIYVLDIKQYIITNNEQHFILVFPFETIFPNSEKHKIADKCWHETNNCVSNLFGLGNIDDYWNEIAILKEISLEKAQVKLFDNGLYYRIDEAMNYSQSQFSEEDRKAFEDFCFETWGAFNRDYLRCHLMRDAIYRMALVSFTEYEKHKVVSTRLRGNPILDRNEWMPVKAEAAESKFKASEDFLFCCSVHRNDKMNSLINLTPEEIFKIRSKRNPSEFRDFFHNVTGSMYFSYDELDEISSEVYSRFDEMLDETVKDIKHQRGMNSFKSVIGIAKTGAGLLPMPFLSILITVNDLLESFRNLFTSLKDKDTIIEHIHKNKE